MTCSRPRCISIWCLLARGDSFWNHNPASISVGGHLEKRRFSLALTLFTVDFIVLFISIYKYIKVTRQNNRGDCRELQLFINKAHSPMSVPYSRGQNPGSPSLGHYNLTLSSNLNFQSCKISCVVVWVDEQGYLQMLKHMSLCNFRYCNYHTTFHLGFMMGKSYWRNSH